MTNQIVTSKYGPVVVNSNDKFIGQHIKVKGSWCDHEVSFIVQLLRQGDVVVEVGSNIGAHTLPIAKAVGPSGRVHAYEPQRIVFYQLAAMVALNNLSNVFCHHQAAGEAIGSALIPPVDYDKPGNFGSVSLLDGWGGDVQPSDAEPERVDVVTVDSLALDKVRLIKVDAEGMDLSVLKGALDTINRTRPAIYTEVNFDGSEKAIFTFINGLNYRVYLHSSPGNHNFACIPREWDLHINGLHEVVLD